MIKRDKTARTRKSNIQQAIFDAHINYTRDDYTSSLTSKVIEIAKADGRETLILEDFSDIEIK